MKKWEFAPELVFSRMTLFLDRLHAIQVNRLIYEIIFTQSPIID